MCGRFTQHYTWAEVYDFLNLLGPPKNLQARYNIAPTTWIDVVRLDEDGERELVRMRWWCAAANATRSPLARRAHSADQRPACSIW
jgi:putative SOS response-associated peptidase YedK